MLRTSTKKQYAIWYNGGSGGFIVSWLLELCLDPNSLTLALENFPDTLIDNPLTWQRYEKVPPRVGLLCNSLEPNLYYSIDNEQYVKSLLDSMHQGSKSVYDLFFCRCKYFLVNHVYQQGHTPSDQYLDVKQCFPEHANIQYFKHLTDILFEPDQNVFVYAPNEYQKISQRIKQSRQIQSNIKDFLSRYPKLKLFEIRAIWQGTYIQELEKILGIKINRISQQACDLLVDHYLKVSPRELKKWCQTHWNI